MPDFRDGLRPNAVDVGRTFDLFHVPGKSTELRILHTDQGTISGYFDDRETFVSAVCSVAHRAPATYVTVNPGHSDLLARAHNRLILRARFTTADTQITHRRFAPIDVDPVRVAGISASDSEHDYAIERLYAIENILRAEGFPEFVIGDSGNGCHGLLRLNLPNDDYSRNLVQAFLKVLANRVDNSKCKVDQSVYNAARIIKVYGTPVRKGDNLPDRPHRISRWLKLLEEPQPVSVEVLEAFAREGRPCPSTTTNGPGRPSHKPASGGRKFNLDDFIERHSIETRPPEAYNGGRIFRLLCCVFNPEHQAKDAAIIERADGTLCYHCFHSSCSDKTWRDVRKLFEGSRPNYNGGPPPHPPSSALPPTQSQSLPSPPQPPSATSTNGAGAIVRPVINAGDYQLRNIIAESLAALRGANLIALASGQDQRALFTRGGQIVEIVKVSNRTVIRDATDSMLRRQLSLAADFVKYTRNSERGVPPPQELPHAVMDTHPGEEWGLLPVDAVVEVPAFRPDGTIIDREGYDRSTRLYYAPGPGLNSIRVPLFPAREEIRAAKDFLGEVLIDFPFVDDASRTNVIAALLTLFIRPAIRGCVPALGLDATTQGSGKTLIAKIISLIVTGQDAILHAAPSEPEEWRKKLTAILRYGPTLIVFDNVVHPLSSDALSCALTSGVYADRILGFSEKVEMPVRCLIMLTGNNLKFVGDMTRRVFLARQDPQMPHPEKRSGFRHPELENWVLANRVRLIEAVLMLIRAWFVAGQPKADLHLGSFDDWAQTIGGILRNAEIDHFLENRTAPYATDADVSEFGAFLLEVKEILPEPFLTIELVKMLSNPAAAYDRLRESLPDWMREKQKDEGQFCAFLGNLFSKRLDKRNPPSGVYITRDGHTGGKVRWKIVVPELRDQLSAASRPSMNGHPRDEDAPPPRKGGAPVEATSSFTLNIKGKGPVTFPSQEAADAFRNAHPEVIG
jgi:hypothetical protein